MPRCFLLTAVFTVLAIFSSSAQQSAPATSVVVPRLIRFGGTVAKPAINTPAVGITFALYRDAEGGAPLWLETQNVSVDGTGHYTALLGATKPEGVPMDLFTSGDARWLGVAVEGQPEQARVLLVAVPYALKAADAETVGGLPPSAFVMSAAPNNAASTNETTPVATQPSAAGTTPVTTAGGKINQVAKFDASADIANSILTDTGTNIGIGIAAPTTTLDVNGAATVRGTLNLPPTAVATTSAGTRSQGLNLAASTFNTGLAKAVNQTFRWQSEPVNNNSASPSGTLNLLFGANGATPVETGLNVASNGRITFAPGQTFSGNGSGLSNVNAAQLGGVSSSGFAKLASANIFTKPQQVKSTASGSLLTVTAGATDVFTVDNFGNLTNNGVIVSANDINTFGSLFANGLAVTGASSFTASSASLTAVYGQSALSPFGVGVFGQTGNESSTGSNIRSTGYLPGLQGVGVWGDGGAGSDGVLGTADDGSGGIFINHSVNSQYPALAAYAVDSTGGLPWEAVNLDSDFGCWVDHEGNLGCFGMKNAVVPIENGRRSVALAAIESPQNWFEDFGSAQLVNGAAVVAIDPSFVQTVNTDLDYKVFLSPLVIAMACM